jgi:iron complex transport system permease protein
VPRCGDCDFFWSGSALDHLPSSLSFVGALLALFLVYAIATRRGRTPVATLLLAGVALNALVGAATSF